MSTFDPPQPDQEEDTEADNETENLPDWTVQPTLPEGEGVPGAADFQTPLPPTEIAGRVPVPAPKPPPPPSFGPFLLGPPVGSGGMAEVRLAYERRPEGAYRPCVLKRIRASHASEPKYRGMFVEEMRLASILKHPNIVCAYDSGEIDGIQYIAFELIDGVTLAEFRRRSKRRLPPSVVVEVGLRIVEALEYAHDKPGEDGRPLKLVHRDVSPQNILISTDGEIKLADFGIAFFEGRDYQTVDGDVKGKLKYMPMEQLRDGVVDQRTDIYTLGLVLAEMLKLTQPGVVMQLMAELIDYPGPELPRPLYDLVVHMTAHEPADRPQRLSEVKKTLDALTRSVSGSRLADFGAAHVFVEHVSILDRTAAQAVLPPGATAVLDEPVPGPDDDDEPGPSYSEVLDLGFMPTLIRGPSYPELPSDAETRRREETRNIPATIRSPRPASADVSEDRREAPDPASIPTAVLRGGARPAPRGRPRSRARARNHYLRVYALSAALVMSATLLLALAFRGCGG